MSTVAEISYDYDIAKLVAAYKRAGLEILRELYAMDPSDVSQANAKATLSEIGKILSALDDEAAAWVAANIPRAVTDGIIRTLIDIGAASSEEEARSLVKFNRMNANLIKSAVADEGRYAAGLHDMGITSGRRV